MCDEFEVFSSKNNTFHKLIIDENLLPLGKIILTFIFNRARFWKVYCRSCVFKWTEITEHCLNNGCFRVDVHIVSMSIK